MARRTVFREFENSNSNTPGFRFVGYNNINKKSGVVISIGSNTKLYGYDNFLEVNISSSEILSLFTSPITILPTPSSGSYYDFKIMSEYTHVTNPYSGVAIFYNDSGDLLIPSVQINQSSNQSAVGINSTTVNMLNEGIKLSSIDSDPADGDGSIKVKVYYNTITFG